MSGRILALVDGSTHSDSVCRHAAWLSASLGATVDLLHALERGDGPASDREAGHPPDLRPDAAEGWPDAVVHLTLPRQRHAHHKARALLDVASKTVARSTGEVVNQRLWAGDLRSNVAWFVDEFAGQTRVIVMGRHGQGSGDAAEGLGANVRRLVRGVQDPVLVVPRTFRPIARVILAFDASPNARRLVAYLASSPALRGLDVSVVHAGEDTDDLRARLGAACRQLRLAGHVARAEVLPGRPRMVLRDVVERDRCDLLVMGAFGRSRLRRLLVGSTTTAVIRSCARPILLVR